MTMQGWFLILAFVAILVATAKPMGLWLFALYEGRRTPLHLILSPSSAASTPPPASIPPRSRAGVAMRCTCCCSTRC